MIKNIWSQLSKIETYITDLNISVPIYVWKPPNKEWNYIWFWLVDNSEWITTDRMWQRVLTKQAVLQFTFVWENETVDQTLYELLDELSNKILLSSKKDLWDFIITSIIESSQSGVIRAEKERPYIVGNYIFNYKYYYE